MHLAGHADSTNLTDVDAGGEFANRGADGGPPLVGILLAPAGPGRLHGVGAVTGGNQRAGFIDRDDPAALRADVNPDVVGHAILPSVAIRTEIVVSAARANRIAGANVSQLEMAIGSAGRRWRLAAF